MANLTFERMGSDIFAGLLLIVSCTYVLSSGWPAPLEGDRGRTSSKFAGLFRFVL